MDPQRREITPFFFPLPLAPQRKEREGKTDSVVLFFPSPYGTFLLVIIFPFLFPLRAETLRQRATPFTPFSLCVLEKKEKSTNGVGSSLSSPFSFS